MTATTASAASSVLRLSHDVFSDVARTSDVKVAGAGDGDGEAASSFADLNLKKHVLDGLAASGFSRPSPVQWEAIPKAALGVDLIVQSKAGTGKTLVYVAAAMHVVDVEKEGVGPQVSYHTERQMSMSKMNDSLWQMLQFQLPLFKKFTNLLFASGPCDGAHQGDRSAGLPGDY